MKTRLTVLLLAALSFAPYATAGNDSIEELAVASGLNTRQVQMVLGARTPHAAYLTSYERVRKQFIRAVGQERFEELVRGYLNDELHRRANG